MGEVTQPFRVMLRMQIKPGMEQDFEKVWRDVGTSVTSHPANLGQWLSRSLDEEGVYYIVSDWVDEPRFGSSRPAAATSTTAATCTPTAAMAR